MTKDPTHPVPDEEFLGENLEDLNVIACDAYSVCEWTPEKDGRGKPEMVCFVLHLGADLDGAQVVVRIKSRPEANRLINILRRHRDGVWPLCRLCHLPEADHVEMDEGHPFKGERALCARCALPESFHGHGETGREDSHPFEGS